MRWDWPRNGREDNVISRLEPANDMERLPAHFVRFAVLAVGLLVVVELIFAAWGCLEHIEYVKALNDVVSCASMPLLVFTWWQPATEIHLILVMLLASAGTALWAWWDHRRS